MNRKLLMSIIVVVFLILSGVLVGYFIYSGISKKVIYTITYDDGAIPGSTYTLSINEDYEIDVSKATHCSTKECIEGNLPPEVTEYHVTFEDKEKLKSFVSELFDGVDGNTLTIRFTDINDSQRSLLNSVLFNDEDLFNYAHVN